METEKHIEKIKRTKRLVLTYRQWFQHYYITFLPLVLMGIFIYLDTTIIKEFWILTFPIISLIAYLIQRKKLRFKEFNANCTKEDLIESFNRSSNELKWKVETTTDYLQAYSDDPFNYFGGNVITIIPTENGLLINSVSDPRRRSVPFFSNWDNENIKIFIKHLKNVLNNQEDNKEYLIPEKEWTTKRVLIRLFMYPFWIFVILMSVDLLSSSNDLRSSRAGIGGLIFGIGYIAIDLILIKRRKKYERTTKAHT